MKAAMNIQARKLKLVQMIINTDKSAILKRIEDVLKKETVVDWWDEISEAEKKKY